MNAAPDNHPAKSLPFSHPTQQGWKVYYHEASDGSVKVDDAYWDITVTSSGTYGAGSSNSINLLNDGSNDNSGYGVRHEVAHVQLGGATKKYYLETIVMVTAASVADTEWFVGWTNDETPRAAGGTAWDFEDGFGFGQLDTGTPVFVTNDTDSEQSISLSGALTTAVFRKYACYFDGTNYNIYEDDILQTVVNANPAVVANVPLGLSMNFKSGAAAAQDLEIKYVLLAVEL